MGQGSGRFNNITTLEKTLVSDSWMEMRTQIREFGISLFLLMINDYPHFAMYWPFTSVNDNSFEKFSTQFMREFDLYVLNINRPTKMYGLLYRNAAYHVPKKIPSIDYDRLRKCIINVIIDRVGTRTRHNEIVSAWIKVVSICFSFLCDMQEDIANEQNMATPIKSNNMIK